MYGHAFRGRFDMWRGFEWETLTCGLAKGRLEIGWVSMGGQGGGLLTGAPFHKAFLTARSSC